MRAVAPPPPAPWLFLPRDRELQLIHLRPSRPAAPRWAAAAHFPPGWQEVPHSRIQSALQTVATYRKPGMAPAQYHRAGLPLIESPAKAVAAVSLSEHRVSILPCGNGYEARWNAGDTWHRVSGGPADLGGFMELILGLAIG